MNVKATNTDEYKMAKKLFLAHVDISMEQSRPSFPCNMFVM